MKPLKKWAWKTKKVSPQVIIDSATHLKPDKDWFEADLCLKWRKATTYLDWAEHAFARKDEFGWDAARCYAKRAVCCQIDRFMLASHFGRYLDKRNYPQKMHLLQEVGITLPTVLHELIIDPRNEIEHGYDAATEKQARHAVEICKMFLRTIEFVADSGAIISLGDSPTIGSPEAVASATNGKRRSTRLKTGLIRCSLSTAFRTALIKFCSSIRRTTSFANAASTNSRSII